MNIYLESFGIFFKIGAFTIGGGYAMVPLIENEIVTKRKWIAQEDFIDLLAISQSFYLYRIQVAWYPRKYYHSIRNNFAFLHHYIGDCSIFP